MIIDTQNFSHRSVKNIFFGLEPFLVFKSSPESMTPSRPSQAAKGVSETLSSTGESVSTAQKQVVSSTEVFNGVLSEYGMSVSADTDNALLIRNTKLSAILSSQGVHHQDVSSLLAEYSRCNSSDSEILSRNQNK